MKIKRVVILCVLCVILLASCKGKTEDKKGDMGEYFGNEFYQVKVAEAVLSDEPINIPNINERVGVDQKIKFDKDGNLLEGKKYLILRILAKSDMDKNIEISLPDSVTIEGKDASYLSVVNSITDIKDTHAGLIIPVLPKKETSLYIAYVIDKESLRDIEQGKGEMTFNFIEPLKGSKKPINYIVKLKNIVVK